MNLIPHTFLGLAQADMADEPAAGKTAAKPDAGDGDVFELAVGEETVRCVHERGRGIAFRIWPGAQFLVKYFTEDPEGKALFAGKTPFVLELGSGTGLVGLVLAALGCPVVLT